MNRDHAKLLPVAPPSSLSRFFSFIVLCVLTALLTKAASGQVAPGMPVYSAFDAHEVDTVDLMNNAILISTPIMSKSGAFPLNFSMSGNYYVFSTNAVWQTASAQLNTELNSAANGFISSNGLTANTPITGVTCPGGGTTTRYTNWSVIEANGTQHPLPPGDYSDRTSGGTSCLTGSGFTAQTTDNSGLTVTVPANGNAASSIFERNGTGISANLVTDSNSNDLVLNAGTITDTLGLAAVTATSPTLGPFSWTNVSGSSSQLTVSTTSPKLETAFGCPGIGEINNTFTTTLASGSNFPDGTSLGITYETTPGHSPNVTGRIKEIILREGGTVTYTYGGSNNGINCTYQTVPTLTRTQGNGDITTYTLAYSIIGGGPGYQATNTVIDPGGNKTIYTFTGFNSTGVNSAASQLLTQVQHYQGASTLLTTDVYCYNGVSSNCSTTATATGQITEVDVYHTISGMSTSSRTQTFYDVYGNITFLLEYDFGATSYTRRTIIAYGSWNGSACVSIGNNINDKPCNIAVDQPNVGQKTYVAGSLFSYDSHGNLAATSLWNGSAYIGQSTANAYNPNGTPSITYDLANNATTYTYAAANYSHCSLCTQHPFATSINKGGLTVSSTWDGYGGVKLTDVDANLNTTTYGYGSDPFNRVTSIQDPLENVVYKTYPTGSAPDTANSSFAFNTNSIQNTTQTTDVYGRTTNVQTQQSPTATNYDTVSTAYGWSGNYRTVATSEPCSVTSGGTCTTVHTNYLDPLGRLIQHTTTYNEELTHAYTQNDDLSVLLFPPSGETKKQVQTQYDGLGRPTSICAISSIVSGNISCGQNTNTSATGVLTTNSYTSATGSTTISSIRGLQTRSQTYDALGRVRSVTTPEGGTVSYYWDTSAPDCNNGEVGTLNESKDGLGNINCYYHDALGRLVTHSANGAAGHTCRIFAFDTEAAPAQTPPTGYSLANTAGRVVEAYTNDCNGGAPIVDEWFSYDKGGHMTDMWELTPHSGTYYHSHATFAGNGIPLTVQLANPGLYTETYGLDGEGRPATLSSSGTTIVAAQRTTHRLNLRTSI